MKKLEDITYRHELIERYLNADTSVEEEQALADFYRHCENKDLTDEDLDIRNLMLGMEKLYSEYSSDGRGNDGRIGQKRRDERTGQKRRS